MRLMKNSLTWSFGIITAIFTFVPEAVFAKFAWVSKEAVEGCGWTSYIDVQSMNTIISRLICFLLVWGAVSFAYFLFLKLRIWTTIKGRNYSIRIEYGNILKKRRCKRVISFDECYTTKVGSNPEDINPGSICGQYLQSRSRLNIPQLIAEAGVEPEQSKSKFRNQTRYASGTIVPNGDDLLLAFAKLDERGKGRFFSRDEYLACLDRLWKELEYYYAEKDVCVPILGAGTTSFDGGEGASISQQDLLDLMIWSYRMSSHKIKAPHKLRIICRKNDEFSLDDRCK